MDSVSGWSEFFLDKIWESYALVVTRQEGTKSWKTLSVPPPRPAGATHGMLRRYTTGLTSVPHTITVYCHLIFIIFFLCMYPNYTHPDCTPACGGGACLPPCRGWPSLEFVPIFRTANRLLLSTVDEYALVLKIIMNGSLVSLKKHGQYNGKKFSWFQLK